MHGQKGSKISASCAAIKTQDDRLEAASLKLTDASKSWHRVKIQSSRKMPGDTRPSYNPFVQSTTRQVIHTVSELDAAVALRYALYAFTAVANSLLAS